MFNAGPVDISWAVQNSQVNGILAVFYPAQVRLYIYYYMTETIDANC